MPPPSTKDILRAILHEVQSGESSEDEAIEQIIKVVLKWEGKKGCENDNY